MHKDNVKKEAGASEKSKSEKSGAPKSQVTGTAGGEMPDPTKMPSKTKFHTDEIEKKDKQEKK